MYSVLEYLFKEFLEVLGDKEMLGDKKMKEEIIKYLEEKKPKEKI